MHGTLVEACGAGDAESIARILKHGGPQLDAPMTVHEYGEYGVPMTPLMMTVTANTAECMGLIIEARASLDKACGHDGETPLVRARVVYKTVDYYARTRAPPC